MSGVKTIVVDMEEEMHKYAIEIVGFAFENKRTEKDIANLIKTEFDQKYDKVWNVIVGRDFGSHVVYQTKRYIFLSYNENTHILIWKSN
jgi:dynein light chain LC8-type